MSRGPKAQPKRWPAEPLMRFLDLDNCSQLMRAVRCNGTVARVAINEGLTDRQADTWACRHSHHPIEIWPDWFDPYLKEQAA
jgi:hypothetical protein